MLGVEIDGKYYSPLSFKSFSPNPINASEFLRCGVRLFSVPSTEIICALDVPYSRFGESWSGDGEYTDKSTEERFVANVGKLTLKKCDMNAYLLIKR